MYPSIAADQKAIYPLRCWLNIARRGLQIMHVKRISSGIVAGRTYFPQILAKTVRKTMRGGFRLRVMSDCNSSHLAKFLQNVKATYFVPRELT